MTDLGTSRRARLGLAVVLVTFATAMLHPAAPLYADVYPGGGAALEHALAQANLSTSFADPHVRQFQPTTFVATIRYGRPVDPRKPVVDIAASNVALLTSSPKDFAIRPLTSDRRDLNEGTRLPGGGYRLPWAWRVTPLRAGDLSLTLRIIPTVVIGGHVARGLRDRNEPVDVTVKVSPLQQAFDDVVSHARTVHVDGADSLKAHRTSTVSATLPVPRGQRVLNATLALEPAPGSVPVTITEPTAAGTTGSVHQTWFVTPQRTGPVRLQLETKVAANAGVTVLQADVVRPVSVDAGTPLSEQLWLVAKVLGGVLLAGITVLTKVGEVLPFTRKLHRYLRRKLAGGDTAQPSSP